MIDPFEKRNVNLELEMVWVIVSPKNVVVLRLNLVCESMLCRSVWFYWKCLVLFTIFWIFALLMCIDTCHCSNFTFIDIVYSNVNFSTMILPWYLMHQMSIITFKLEFKLWVVNSMSVLLVKHLLFFKDTSKLQGVVNFDCDFTLLPSAPASIVTVRLELNYELSIQCQFCW